MLNSPMRGKWAQGIVPRNFAWIIKDRLALSERPGGHGPNHRPVRRMEEIIWLKQESFTRVISLLPSPHNLHAYAEHEMASAHVPFGPHADPVVVLGELYPRLREWLNNGERVLIHLEEVGDRMMGVIGGFLIWSGKLPNVMQAINVVEHLLARQMGSPGRELVAAATRVAGSAVAPVDEPEHDLGRLPPVERKVRKLKNSVKPSRKLLAKAAERSKPARRTPAPAAAKPAPPTPLPKKASAKKAAVTKKAMPKKTAAVTKKAPAKKAAVTKKAAAVTKKAPASKKAPAKKALTKKAAAVTKKAPASKKAPAKKDPAKKAPAKKVAAKKATAKKASSRR